MISLPDITIVTPIYESANSLVYRGILKVNQQPLILKLLKQDYPTSAELYRYQQEYEIIRHLDLEGVIKVYELRRYKNTLLILLEDFGGDSLKLLLERRPFSLSEFLTLSLKITEALGKIHYQNIIHKDINPSNIVFNPQTGQLKLIDFGLSSILSQENPTLKSPNTLEGTLAYLSPEQTGRMNRNIDYRTDFYSLGITFYQLLTNQLPFPQYDALELIHSHLARQPLPPHKINPEIPLPISEIVMKLMAKTAEERYQSALGIKADLETCLTQSKNQETQTFILGSQDICHYLQISQKLYGREQQIQTLLNTLTRVVSPQAKPNSPELILISGYSGIGKSALVRELYQLITEKRGYFISGKFDQLYRDIPYQALISAFKDLMRQLLTESETQLQQWRHKILAELGVNAQIIIDIIPELELIIGQQIAVTELSLTEAQHRFNLVFRQFIQIFCQPEHPLVLFLDDLQWVDSATLKLLQVLITQANTQYLLVIAAYRDHEVCATHPLMLCLSAMENQGIVINNISLSPLNLRQVNQLIADTLKTELRATQNLAELVFLKTQGNPFFVKEFIKSLYTEELLKFDQTLVSWTWDLEKIRMRNLTDNVVELMSGKIQALSISAQTVLQLAACIGNQFDLKILAILYHKSLKETADKLIEAELGGLIFPLGDDYKFLKTNRDLNGLKINYKFAHDRIQQAAYSLIPENSRKAIHLSIGQLLLKYIPPEKQAEKIFDIVEQLNLGFELLKHQFQRDKSAQLNLIAAQKAKASAAYQIAFNYLIFGLQLLPESRWKTHYDLTLALQIEAAEAAYLCGNFDETERLSGVVLQQAKTLLDKVKIYEVQMAALVAQGKLIEAISIGIAVLKLLGIDLPKTPNQFDVFSSFIQTKFTLLGKKIEDLIDQPEMLETDKIAAVSILVNLSPVAYIAFPNLFPILVFKSVNLLVKFGYTQLGEVVYAGYGLILCAALGDIESGYRFGNLALQHLKKSHSNQGKTKVIFSVNGFTKIWREHLKNSLPPLLEGYGSGLDTGDLENAAYCAMLYAYYYVLTGQDLTQVERDIAQYIEAVQKIEQTRTAQNIGIHRQVVLNLLGQSENPTLLRGESYDEWEKIPLALAAQDQTTLFDTYSYKLTLSYLFEDYEQALKNAKLTEKYLDGGLGTPAIPIFYFYDSLTRLALYPSLGKIQQKMELYRIKNNQSKLKKWAGYAPMNYLHKFYLVEAQRYQVLGQQIHAIECYDKAISLAQKNEYLQEEALANEQAAKFYLAWGKEKIAQTYFKEAYYCYQRWGARAKIQDLEAKYPQFFQPLTAVTRPFNPHQSLPNHSRGRNLNQVLDQETLMKAAFAISSEIELDQLLTTLIKILLENTGAQTSYLILESQGKLWVQATGKVDSEEVRISQSIPEAQDLPLSIINYVARTQESLVFNYASQEIKTLNYRDFPIKTDPYLQIFKPKSLVCVPLLNGGQLIGVIYLENHLVSGTFTPERLEIIKLLSTQAAISLTNAHLHTQVRINESRLHKFLDAIPLGISVYGATGQIAYANQMAQQFLDVQDLPAVGDQADPREPYPPNQRLLMRSLSGESATTEDWQLHSPDGRIVLEATSTPIFNPQGTVEYAIATFQDITVRLQTQKALIESEQRYAALAKAAPVGIFRNDLQGNCLYGNDRCFEMIGIPQAEAMGTGWTKTLHPQDYDRVLVAWLDFIQQNIPFDCEYRFLRSDNSVIWVFGQAVAEKDPDGHVIGYVGTLTDISERKQVEEILQNYNNTLEIEVAERTAEWVQTNLRLEAEIICRQQIELALRQSEARYLGIIEDQSELIIRYVPNGILTFVNQAYCRFFKVKRSQIIGHDYSPIVFEEDQEYVEKQVNSINRDNPVITIENRVIVEGEVRWTQWINRGIFNENGQIIEYQAVGRDISARKQAEVLLAEAKEVAEAANHAKSVFLANMSHELRTPLNVILGFSRLMNHDANLSKEQQENLNIIGRSGEHLLSLINQVLALSKIEAGKERFNESNFDLYYLLILLEDMFSLKAKDKGLQLIFEREAKVPQYIRTDEAKLRQVLINLLNNAIKFTPVGRVSLKASMENTHLILEVSDTGVGINPEEFDQLFKPFMQTSSSQKVQEGTGLGLVISCQFIQLMGGKITVTSQGVKFTPGENKFHLTAFDESPQETTFKINIPVGICQETEIEKPPQERRVIGLAPNQPEYRMLVVDDHNYSRKLLVKILANLGFQVKEASNGAEAIEIWQGYEPHLIWMDMRMPVMNGYEATQQIKATTQGQATAIIAITASALEEEKAIILSAGCDDFVRKPFQEHIIFDIMAKHLGIDYIYESSELVSDSNYQAEEPLNLTSVLTAMSKLWLVKLYEATLDADSELVSQLLGEIPSSDGWELQVLRDWVKKFEFEKILDLIEPLLEPP